MRVLRRAKALAILAVAVGPFAIPGAAHAQVTRLEIQSRQPAAGGQVFGTAGPYEILRGRVHGEVDPSDPRNAIIQDLQLAPRNARGRVEYIATFALAKPIDLTKASGTLIYTVVNRGNGTVTPGPEGHISLVSGWQGDLVATPTAQTIEVPIARQPDGHPLTGPVIARFVNVPANTTTMPIRLSSMGGSPPTYPPAGLDQPDATLISAASESPTGVKNGVIEIPRTSWAFADCRTTPFPGMPDPARVCLKDGFDPARLYELVYTAKDPLVLGIGLAATRDILAFFRHSRVDSAGTPNPVAGRVAHAIAIGDSQSGNFIKTMIHLGFNEDLRGDIVWDGVFPRIAARQTPMNFRFALPGGAATLYEPGSEPALWWSRYDDKTRARATASLLDRCSASHTCPKVIEAFGSTEFWGLRMSPGLIGTDAKADIPLPSNVRRYYYPGTTHGGGRGGFQVDPPASGGPCALPGNPNPESDTTRALTAALVDWVANGIEPPPSQYPMLARGELESVAAWVRGFPAMPGLAINGQLLNPVLDYDFGPQFLANDLSGVITLLPPRIAHLIPTYVPVTNADGNETSGLPSVLHQAPLGTYLGWNVTASGFFKGQGCGFQGSYVPFARTHAERTAAHDPRPSIEERYGTLDGYVCVVQRAAADAVREHFLLKADGDRLLSEARASSVLPIDANSSAEDRAIAQARCAEH